MCWADRKPKTIISNRGTTLPGSDSVRPRHRLIEREGIVETLRYEKRVKRPQMMALFFSKFSTIDVDDHYRQGSLALERQWLTRNWTHRFFSTLLGMIVVDAFLAYRYDMRDEDPGNFHDFVSQLAYQLIFNSHPTNRTRRSGGSGVEYNNELSHKIKALIDLPQYARARSEGKRAQRLCKVCNKKASYYCESCSDVERGAFFSISGAGATRNCLSAHLTATLG